MAGSGDDEWLSVVDETGHRLQPRGRLDVHRQGLWHEVFHCLIVRTAPPTRVLLQRRRAGARSFAGRLDLSATGHLAAGETPLEGRRELREELGIDVAPEAFVYLGSRLLADDNGEGGRNRERAHVFLLADDRPLAAFPLDPAEVGGLVELSGDDLMTMLRHPRAVVACTEIGSGPEAGLHPSTCRLADLVPAVDGYWTVLAVMADRFVNGQSPIAI